MANLKNAAIRTRINEAFADCRACDLGQCREHCNEAVQTALDEIIDDMRKWFAGKPNRVNPIPREFDCRQCGTHVRVDCRGDKRTVFCCEKCEKEYWRLYYKNQRHKRIAQGHVTHLRKEALENAAERGERL